MSFRLSDGIVFTRLQSCVVFPFDVTYSFLTRIASLYELIHIVGLKSGLRMRGLPRVNWKQPLYPIKVGVRLLTCYHPHTHLWDYVGFVVVDIM